MQMNNAWGVCAFLRGMIRAAGTRTKAGRGRRAARTEGSGGPKRRTPCAGIAAARGERLPPGPRQRRRGGAGYS